jgi:hypothetical protein
VLDYAELNRLAEEGAGEPIETSLGGDGGGRSSVCSVKLGVNPGDTLLVFLISLAAGVCFR